MLLGLFVLEVLLWASVLAFQRAWEIIRFWGWWMVTVSAIVLYFEDHNHIPYVLMMVASSVLTMRWVLHFCHPRVLKALSFHLHTFSKYKITRLPSKTGITNHAYIIAQNWDIMNVCLLTFEFSDCLCIGHIYRHVVQLLALEFCLCFKPHQLLHGFGNFLRLIWRKINQMH